MRKSTLLATLPWMQKRHLGLGEIAVLLDLLPQAAFLYDNTLNFILVANAKATELTAYTRSELNQLTLETLFPEFADGKFPATFVLNPVGQTCLICTRNGNELEVLLTFQPVNSQSSLALVLFESLITYQQNQTEVHRQVHLLENINNLVMASHEQDLLNAIQLVFQAGYWLIGAPIFALYLINVQTQSLQCRSTWGVTDLLPEHIPAIEVNTLLEPHIWTKGKRTTNCLNRAARSASIPYLAHAPIGQTGALAGLLVIADPETPPSDNMLLLLQILATTLTAIIQKNTLSTNLLEIQKQQQAVVGYSEITKNYIQVGVISLTQELLIQELNPSAEKILGYASREVEGEPINSILIGADTLHSSLQGISQGKMVSNPIQVRLHRRSGSAFPAQVSVYPVVINEQLIGIMILLQDQSEIEGLQNRLQQLEQRAFLGEISAAFAHDVGNINNNLSSGLEVVAIDLSDDDPRAKTVAEMKKDCLRIKNLTTSVLEFARPIDINKEIIDLGKLISRLLDRWRIQKIRSNISFHYPDNSDTYFITGDPWALERVFTNLIQNAVQAMGDKVGNLTINIRKIIVSEEQSQIEVSISDDGPGIPKENLERIFEPFFTSRRGGTGLGLPIAKRIVTAHKGTINVTSVPGGTVFQILLPTSIHANTGS